MNTVIEGLVTQINYRIDEMQAVRKDIDAFEAMLIEQCPVKIGDTVTCNGWGYKGRNILINKVAVGTDVAGRPKEFVCYGVVLRDDGTHSLNIGTHSIPLEEVK